MKLSEEQLKIFQDSIKLMSGQVSKTEFIDSFKAIIKLTTEIEKKLIAKIDSKISDTSSETEKMRGMMTEMRSQFHQAVKDATSANDTTFAKLKARSMESIQAMFSKMDVQSKLDSIMKECEDKMSAMPTTEDIKAMIPEQKDETAEDIATKLETLQGDARLDAKAIKNLPESKTIYQGGGGANHPLYALMDVDIAGILSGQSIQWNGTRWVAYTPGSGTGLNYLAATGDVDDSNVTFTFVSEPTLVSVNGALYKDGGGVTIVGTTATLDAPAGTNGSVYGLGTV